MIGIIVISHGDLAKGLLSSGEMISPGQKQVASLSVYPDTNPDDFESQLQELVKKMDTGDGVLILADLLGGTPCNKALPLLSNQNVQILTGVNLPMLLTAFTKRTNETDLHALPESILKETVDAMANLRDLLQEETK